MIACVGFAGVVDAALALFPALSGGLPVLAPLLDVVDQRKQLPLAIDFVLATQGEAIQPFVVADVAKHRLDGGEAAAIVLSALFTVDALTHCLRVSRYFRAREHGDLSYFAGVGFTQALPAQRALFVTSIVALMLVEHRAGSALQLLCLRQKIRACT